MGVYEGALVFAAAAALSTFAVAIVRRLAPRLHLLDVPNYRSLHSTPTPRGGGLAIVVVSAIGLAAAALLGVRPSPAFAGYICGALMIAIAGAIDDMRPLPVTLRLAVQTAAASAMAAPLVFTSSWADTTAVGLTLVAAVVWTVGLTNAFNFMDGIDGLIGAQALVGGVAWAVLASINGVAWAAMLGVLVAGSSLGFLTQNWSPARIFLGDVGSAFLGFTFAFLTLAVPRHLIQVAAAATIVWPVVFDTSATLLRRIARGENIFAAHRTHLYQRMVLAGGHPRRVAVAYAILTLVAGGTAVLLWTANSTAVGLVVAIVVVLESIGLWTAARKVEHRRVAVAAGSHNA